eukprot:790980-Rhodomonas_salina.2
MWHEDPAQGPAGGCVCVCVCVCEHGVAEAGSSGSRHVASLRKHAIEQVKEGKECRISRGEV